MNIKISSFAGTLLGALIASATFAQTVYVPSGTGGIGSSPTANVGIATSNPTSGKLQVEGGDIALGTDGSDRRLLIWSNTDGADAILIRRSDNSHPASIGTSDYGKALIFKPGGNETVRFASSGYVGIGLTNPHDYLEIYGGSAPATIRLSNTSVGNDFVRAAMSGNLELGTYYGHALGLFTSNSERVRIDGAGNVGIGTASPGAKLEVIGGANPFGLIVEGDGSSANARIALRRANATGASATGNIDWIGNDNAVGARIGVNDDIGGSMAFKLGGGALSNTRLFISSAGNVGIGTTNPTQKLSVNGTIRAKEVVVDTGWSDYVFRPDYKLASLSEVEGAIKRDGHLPGIPSVQEVAVHGVTLGEMQSKLLAKIEELTLYMIEMKKENTALRKEMDALKHTTK